MKKSFFFLLCFLQMLSAGLVGEEVLIDLGAYGYVRYLLEDNIPICIERFTSDMELIYAHSYEYDERKRLISEKLIGNLGEVIYQRDQDLTIESPYHYEICELGENGRVARRSLDGNVREYEYTEDKRLLTEPAQKDLTYDTNGNLVQKGDVHYEYDGKRNLTSVKMPGKEVFYGYDEKGRRISKTINGKVEKYLLEGWNELAVLDEKENVTQLRIPGATAHPDIVRPIAIETISGIYAPIFDVQENIIKLVNIDTKEVIDLKAPGPFGENLSNQSPTSWIFAGKFYDKDTKLIYFGKRFYDPEIKQWLTPDPQNQVPGEPYLYCLGDPLWHRDPDGGWGFALTLVTWGGGAITSPVWLPGVATAATAATLGYMLYKGCEKYSEWERKRQAQELIDNATGGVRVYPQGTRQLEKEYWLQKADAYKAKEENQKDGCPTSNISQNKPPYNGKNLGEDASKPPAKGFEWKGRGKAGSKEGSWYNPNTKESLHADFDHPGEIKPHWDYVGPNKEKARIYKDGTWEWKK